jgi:hypothetical protein
MVSAADSAAYRLFDLRCGRGLQSCSPKFRLQFDHIVPHARGGDNSIENLVITCAPCNFARMNYLLEEVGLDNPLTRPKVSSDWGGLEGVMNVPARREDKE